MEDSILVARLSERNPVMGARGIAFGVEIEVELQR